MRYRTQLAFVYRDTAEIERLNGEAAGRAEPCPPADCGGTWGYAELLEVLADPDHEEHESMLEWVGGALDAEHFDLAAVHDVLSLVAAR